MIENAVEVAGMDTNRCPQDSHGSGMAQLEVDRETDNALAHRTIRKKELRASQGARRLLELPLHRSSISVNMSTFQRTTRRLDFGTNINS